MSKLTIIRESLENNLNAIIVDCEERSYVRYKDLVFRVIDPRSERGGLLTWVHTVEYWVAPKKGLYNPTDLQVFMMGLIPKLKPTEKTDFYYFFKPESNNKSMMVGQLSYDEKIGQGKAITIVSEELYDRGLIQHKGFIDGKREYIYNKILRNYMRRILVVPFPDEKIARSILRDSSHPYNVEDVLYSTSFRDDGYTGDKGRAIPLFLTLKQCPKF